MGFSIIGDFLSSVIDASLEKKNSFEGLSVLLLEKGTIMLNKFDFTMLRFIGHERNRNKPTDAFLVYLKPGKNGSLGRREMFSKERGFIFGGGASQDVPVPSSSSCPHKKPKNKPDFGESGQRNLSGNISLANFSLGLCSSVSVCHRKSTQMSCRQIPVHL